MFNVLNLDAYIMYFNSESNKKANESRHSLSTINNLNNTTKVLVADSYNTHNRHDHNNIPMSQTIVLLSKQWSSSR